ncbi:PREDICTED: 60S ribosomal protein L32-like [Elephantulus edwardii]|uniref:60S ribosomal protein L32-like n=1 Tax=Elephantulus edwardii TaxID=28737 RepID=UPI0003F0DE75|nr:PREDICTED: 60S ribosomal protein L32-like [Elephantulus edwardii]
MAAPRPLVMPEIIKKRTKKFIRHQLDLDAKVKHNRYSSRNINNRVWRRLKGHILMTSIGYESSKKTGHMWPSSFCRFPVHDVRSWMCSKSYCAEIAHTVSSKKDKAIVEGAAQLVVRVTNPNAGQHSEEENE